MTGHRAWRKGLLCLACSAHLLLGGFAQAQISPGLKSIFLRLETNNPTLHQQQARITRARARVSEQRSWRWPILQLQARYSHVSELARLEVPFRLPGQSPLVIEAGVRDQYDLALQLQQPIFTGFRISSSIQLASHQLEATRYQQEAMRQQLFYQAGALYYQIQENYWQQAAMEKALQRTRLRLAITRNLFAARQATDFDTLDAYNQVLRLQTSLNDLQNARKILLSRLRQLVNDTTLAVRWDSSWQFTGVPLAPLAHYRQQALQRRAELQSLRASQRATRAQKAVVGASRYPQLSAQIGFHYARPGVNFFQDQWMDYYTAGLQLSWTVFDRGRTHQQIQQARAQEQELTWQQEELRLKIVQQVEEAYWQMRNSMEQLRLQQQLLKQEQERYHRMKNQFANGLISSLDFRNAETVLLEEELRLRSLQIQLARNYLQLKFAVGELWQRE